MGNPSGLSEMMVNIINIRMMVWFIEKMVLYIKVTIHLYVQLKPHLRTYKTILLLLIK